MSTFNRANAHRYLRIGDLIFIRVTARPFLEVASATCSWTNHVGIVVGNRGDDWLIAESTFPLSRITLLSKFLARSEHGAFAVARLRQSLGNQQESVLVSAATRRIGVLYDPGFNLESRRQFCSRFVREVLQESTGEAIGEVQTFRALLERNPAADLRLWKMWYFGRIPWDRTTVTPESIYTSHSLRTVFDGTVAP